MHATPCTSLNDGSGLERLNYFPRQLMKAEDMRQEQQYFRDKLRRHNRLLHGWGVLFGGVVKAGKGDNEVIIEPLYALGPQGDEIVISSDMVVDVSREGLDGESIQPCGDVSDPWCSNVRVDRPAGTKLYLAVRYAECQTRPVRVSAAGCGCDLTECEYSRTRDSYAVKVLTSLPTGYQLTMTPPDPELLFKAGPANENAGRPIPAPSSDPWVVLADLTIGADGNLDKTQIDCYSHRRYVPTFAEFYFLCQPTP